MLIEGDTSAMLSWRRKNHMRGRHGDIPTHLWGKRRKPTEIVETTVLPAEEIDWSCPFCPASKPAHLPKLRKFVKVVSVQHHYDTKHKRRRTDKAACAKARSKRRKRQAIPARLAQRQANPGPKSIFSGMRWS